MHTGLVIVCLAGASILVSLWACSHTCEELSTGMQNIHFTDFKGEGPTLPVKEFCVFPALKEFNIAGMGTPTSPLTGTLPPELGSCFPRVNDYKFSFNQVQWHQESMCLPILVCGVYIAQ